jgi:hypothetical protein
VASKERITSGVTVTIQVATELVDRLEDSEAMSMALWRTWRSGREEKLIVLITQKRSDMVRGKKWWRQIKGIDGSGSEVWPA